VLNLSYHHSAVLWAPLWDVRNIPQSTQLPALLTRHRGHREPGSRRHQPPG